MKIIYKYIVIVKIKVRGQPPKEYPSWHTLSDSSTNAIKKHVDWQTDPVKQKKEWETARRKGRVRIAKVRLTWVEIERMGH